MRKIFIHKKMDTVTLEVKTRDPNVRASRLRRQKLIPIEYYGKGVENKSLQADYQGFRKVYLATGSNTIINFMVDGKENLNVLVQEVERDPVTDFISHVDVINVRMGEKLQTRIPLKFTGTAPAVKELGGILMTNINEIDVKCLPKDLIHNIEVNIDSLVDYNSYIRIKDLVVPDTIAVLNDPEDVVATVVAPKEEEEEEVAEEVVEGAEGEAVEGEEGAREGEEEKEGEGGASESAEKEEGKRKEK
ncbi:50S ribosomal protein L25 [Candidatus Peregrinibacteria bacterium]|nr:50S ribosomal protein L25 [Candidatus Peregrinibacteria bacterium]